MALAKRPAPASTDGLDKKHDSPGPYHNQTWHPTTRMHTGSFFRKRRVLLAILALSAVYLFVHYLPTDLPTARQRIDSRTGLAQGRPGAFEIDPASLPKPSREVVPGSSFSHQLYDGPVKFNHLVETLRPHLYGRKRVQDNVVFLLHDLRSAAPLLGLACETALYNRTNVHVAMMSMYDNDIDEVMTVIGLKQSECPIFWHDARPDYNAHSSKARRAVAIKSALGHLHATLKPAAFIVDDQQMQDAQFRHAVEVKLSSLGTSPVVIPHDALTSASWLATLDGPAFRMFDQNQIDIIIQPYKQSAGSLIKLLNSMQQAKYAGLPFPRITVELPHAIDSFALHYLENFRWSSPERGENKLILRRRIATTLLTPAIASLRTIESFYPPTSPASHVLVLSPDVELRPDYLQYLIYLTLEYKYGKGGRRITGSLMGISLNLPEISLDGKTPFLKSPEIHPTPLLLSQNPSSTATLYFGDKWVELQDYLSLRLKHDSALSESVHGSLHISEQYPAWLKLASELMQAKNYYILYPGFARDPTSRLITVHTELHQNPEEYAKLSEHGTKETGPATSIPELRENTVLTGDDEAKHAHANLKHKQIGPPSISLTQLLGLKGREVLPEDHKLPTFATNGKEIKQVDAQLAASLFGDQISLELGGCSTLEDRDKLKAGTVGYFFCARGTV